MTCTFLSIPKVRNQPFRSSVGVVGIQVKNRKDSRHARWWIAANAWRGGFFASTSRPATYNRFMRDRSNGFSGCRIRPPSFASF